MNVFAVASHTGKRVHASECDDRGEHAYPKGHFLCVDCGSDVLVRRGRLRAWHFAHYCELEGQRCPRLNGGESVQHYNAKHFIARNMRKCMFVVRMCYGCGKGDFFDVGRCYAEVEARIQVRIRHSWSLNG